MNHLKIFNQPKILTKIFFRSNQNSESKTSDPWFELAALGARALEVETAGKWK